MELRLARSASTADRVLAASAAVGARELSGPSDAATSRAAAHDRPQARHSGGLANADTGFSANQRAKLDLVRRRRVPALNRRLASIAGRSGEPRTNGQELAQTTPAGPTLRCSRTNRR